MSTGNWRVWGSHGPADGAHWVHGAEDQEHARQVLSADGAGVCQCLLLVHPIPSSQCDQEQRLGTGTWQGIVFGTILFLTVLECEATL